MSCRLLRVPARYRSRALRRRGIAVRAECDELGRVTARLIGRLLRAYDNRVELEPQRIRS